MNKHQQTTYACLGTGGATPAAWMLSDDDAPLQRILELPKGHSVYAITMDPESGRLAIGSRGGRVHLFSWPGVMGAGEEANKHTFVQGAPILSVCFAGDSLLAAGDTAGRCLLWRVAEHPEPPSQLPSPGGPICSLLNLADSELVGLSASGELVFWSLPSGELVRMTKGAPPPETTALVPLVCWPAASALVYPGRDGQLVAYGLDDGRVTSRAAHDGDFLYVAVSGDRLQTIGRADGQFKTWQVDHDAPVEVLEAPMGVVSGAVIGDTPQRLLLVTDAGTAGVYRCEGGALLRERQLDGQSFRVAAGPSPQARMVLHERQRLARVQSLRTRILEMIDRDASGDMDALHAELITLGFEEVSLALRARYASVRNDLIGELDARHRLASILPEGDRKTVGSLRPYAALLESTWRIVEACEVRESLYAMGEPFDGMDQLTSRAEILKGDDWVIEPDIPMATIVRAASAVGRRVRGRWLIRMLKPVPFQHGRVSADMIAARYEKVRLENAAHALPPAETATLAWLSRTEIRHVETVTVGQPLDGPRDGQRIAVQVLHDGIQSVVVPAVLLDANDPDPNIPVVEHNNRVLRALERIEQGDLRSLWQRRLLHFILVAVQRLLTEAAAEPAIQERA